MAQISILTNERRMRRRRSQSGRRLGLVASVLFSLGLALGLLLAGAAYASLTHDLPPVAQLETLLAAPDGLLLQPSQIYDRSGRQLLLTLQNPAALGRQYLSVDPQAAQHVAPAVISATLALSAPDWLTPASLFADSSELWRSGPIAEKLVGELLVSADSPGWRSRLRRELLAWQAAGHYGQAQLLEWYLNSANYGRQAYGIDAAARVYFGKSASQVNLAEAALLAGLAETPAFNPFDAPVQAVENQGKVLEALLERGWISAAQFRAARTAELVFQPAANWAASPYSAFVEAAVGQLRTDFDWERLERGGLRVITSLDADLQFQAYCAAQAYLAELRSEVVPAASNPQACPAAAYLPVSGQSLALAAANPQINLLSLDPTNGQILALIDSGGSQQPGALRTARPPGTLLTPFVYLTGFTRGLSPATLTWDIPPAASELAQAAADAPPDLDGEYAGPLRLRLALASDELVPAVRVYYQVGAQTNLRTLQQFGLYSQATLADLSSPQILWEGGELTLQELAQAYGILANGGVWSGVPPAPAANGDTNGAPGATTLLRVETLDGESLANWETPQRRPVLTPQLSYLLNDVLSDETARWGSLGQPNALEIGQTSAAKIGQTGAGQDSWAIGYTPELLTAAWSGISAPDEAAAGVPGQSGDLSDAARLPVQTAAGLWQAVMRYAASTRPLSAWSEPAGLSRVQVCDPSGLLPTAECPNRVTELFVNGSEPTGFDNLYRTFKINQASGLLATVVTPPELVEERTYLVAPAEAQTWARQTGLPVPPESYDLVSSTGQTNPAAAILAPEGFSAVRGVVTLQGSASGEGFAFYRLQYGEGLNPQNWFQIGQERPNRVSNGLLGLWDTRGLSGLLAVQLLVVDDEQRVQSAVILVTVDNEAPQVQISAPQAGQTLTARPGQPLNLQAEASDNLSVKTVEFWVDGELAASLPQAPYVYPWLAVVGEHSLLVRVIDQAGNTAEQQIEFRVQR